MRPHEPRALRAKFPDNRISKWCGENPASHWPAAPAQRSDSGHRAADSPRRLRAGGQPVRAPRRGEKAAPAWSSSLGNPPEPPELYWADSAQWQLRRETPEPGRSSLNQENRSAAFAVARLHRLVCRGRHSFPHSNTKRTREAVDRIAHEQATWWQGRSSFSNSRSSPVRERRAHRRHFLNFDSRKHSAFHRPPPDFSSLAHGIGPEAVPSSKWLVLSTQWCPVRPVGMSAVFAGSVQTRRTQK